MKMLAFEVGQSQGIDFHQCLRNPGGSLSFAPSMGSFKWRIKGVCRGLPWYTLVLFRLKLASFHIPRYISNLIRAAPRFRTPTCSCIRPTRSIKNIVKPFVYSWALPSHWTSSNGICLYQFENICGFTCSLDHLGSKPRKGWPPPTTHSCTRCRFQHLFGACWNVSPPCKGIHWSLMVRSEWLNQTSVYNP